MRSFGKCAEPVGMRTVKAVPFPGTLVTAIAPPCSLTNSCTRARPIPEPSCDRARAANAMETLENVRQVALRYARAGITDDELYAIPIVL